MKLNEIILNPNEVGIFKTINELDSSLEFINQENASELDIDYVYNHSGNKNISTFYSILLSKEADGLLNSLTQLAKTCLTRFKANWVRSYTALQTEYNALDNYSMQELEKVNSKISSSNEVLGNTYGFNSNEAEPTSKALSASTSEGSKNDNYRELSRSGNIGVTTSQQMLESELKLRTYDFFDRVMNDIDSIVCLKCY